MLHNFSIHSSSTFFSSLLTDVAFMSAATLDPTILKMLYTHENGL